MGTQATRFSDVGYAGSVVYQVGRLQQIDPQTGAMVQDRNTILAYDVSNPVDCLTDTFTVDHFQAIGLFTTTPSTNYLAVPADSMHSISMQNLSITTVSDLLTTDFCSTFNSVQEMDRPTFSLFPNPATDGFQVRSERAGLVEVIDASGRIIHLDQFTENTDHTINTRFDPGIYLVRLSWPGLQEEQATKRLVIH